MERKKNLFVPYYQWRWNSLQTFFRSTWEICCNLFKEPWVLAFTSSFFLGTAASRLKKKITSVYKTPVDDETVCRLLQANYKKKVSSEENFSRNSQPVCQETICFQDIQLIVVWDPLTAWSTWSRPRQHW